MLTFIISLVALVFSGASVIIWGFSVKRIKHIFKTAKIAYSMMGKQSAISRQAKKVEKGIMENLVNLEAPEVKFIISLLPEDLRENLEQIEPEVWLYLIQKYRPLIEAYLSKQSQKRSIEYKIE